MSEYTDKIRPHVITYKIGGVDKELFLLSDVNLANLSAGDGNPIEIMDLGLVLQTLSLEQIALDVKSLKKTRLNQYLAILKKMSLNLLVSIGSITKARKGFRLKLCS